MFTLIWISMIDTHTRTEPLKYLVKSQTCKYLCIHLRINTIFFISFVSGSYINKYEYLIVYIIIIFLKSAIWSFCKFLAYLYDLIFDQASVKYCVRRLRKRVSVAPSSGLQRDLLAPAHRPPHYTLIASMQILQHFNLRKVRFRVNTPLILKARAARGHEDCEILYAFSFARGPLIIRLNINLCWIISSKLMVYCL